jgi:hypothetical protein
MDTTLSSKWMSAVFSLKKINRKFLSGSYQQSSMSTHIQNEKEDHCKHFSKKLPRQNTKYFVKSNNDTWIDTRENWQYQKKILVWNNITREGRALNMYSKKKRNNFISYKLLQNMQVNMVSKDKYEYENS